MLAKQLCLLFATLVVPVLGVVAAPPLVVPVVGQRLMLREQATSLFLFN